MSAADFRQVANRSKHGKAERLFRAAVSAFCSLTRPTRLNTIQLAQLTLPLFDGVSIEARRYVAAALSDSRAAPHALVLRLADQSVDVAAPILLRSPVLSDADLVALIARHGLDHARVIARRSGLNAAIAGLASALEEARCRGLTAGADGGADSEWSVQHRAEGAPPPVEDQSETEMARQRLRVIMSNGGAEASASALLTAGKPPSPRDIYRNLKSTVLSNGSAFFRTALADALGIDYQTARIIADAPSYDDLIAAMRHFDLSEEEAFLLVCAACPTRFLHPRAVRTFIEKFRQFDTQAAENIVRGWKAGSAFASQPRPAVAGGGATVLALDARRKSPSVRRA